MAVRPDALFLGLMSGTSADAIDAALVAFEPDLRLLAVHSEPWPAALRARILDLARSDAALPLVALGELDARIADAFARAANAALANAGIAAAEVAAIGSHGQTVCHRPDADPPFTLQLGDPARIAEATGIDVVADFRRADMAAGGQGAPLLPIVHQQLFAHPTETRVVLNLGGIANISVLRPGGAVTGFDTGPANALLDAWAQRHLHQPVDRDGAWAASGNVDEALLARCLADPYLQRPPPKSTGREYFNLAWLDRLAPGKLASADVQATLLALTATSVARAIADHAADAERVIACGGGVHNRALMTALAQALAPTPLETTQRYGVDPDFLEATAFAWLARRRLLGLPGNLPGVTGARGPRVLGAWAAGNIRAAKAPARSRIQ